MKGERVACQEMRMIRWSAITLRAGVMLHRGMKKKETGTDRDNERTRDGKKRGCYMCVLYAMTHTHVHVQRNCFNVCIECTRAR